MTKQKGILLSISSILLGFALNGLAWTILPGPMFSTLGLLLGIALFIFGVVMLIISVNKN
ncbi:MAG: hypothetical protein M0D53_10885 [Flavobacterium sp. JAD_PAG50586_2]|nr:MAG: hypothetical protein M0D53_10885 [Flavobacterium sp. JAD_PAG50586_2]